MNKRDGDPRRQGGAYPPKARQRRSRPLLAQPASLTPPGGKLARGMRRFALRVRFIEEGPGPKTERQRKQEAAFADRMRSRSQS